MKSTPFEPSQFLSQYWQQQPFVLPKFIPDFVDPIDEHDLAGIAQEADADSRIVSRDGKGQWTNTNGPFEDFNAVCVNRWSLLVQGVESYIDSIDDLFESFAFIPYWRMDDVMISYSVKGAGVGAHIDQYDVFLIQGKGKRRWQIGKPGNYQEHDKNGLRQIDEFEPVIDVVTEAGDVIYIPPGWPHKGETIENSLTYSIGFRAPDTEQLVNVMHEALETSAGLNQRYTDPARNTLNKPAMIGKADFSQLKEMLTELIQSNDFDENLLSMLSDSHRQDIDEAQSISINEIHSALINGCDIKRVEGVRPIYVEPEQHSSAFRFYVNGEQFSCESSIHEWIEPMLNQRIYHCELTINDPIQSVSTVLNQLIKSGYYYIE